MPNGLPETAFYYRKLIYTYFLSTIIVGVPSYFFWSHYQSEEKDETWLMRGLIVLLVATDFQPAFQIVQIVKR